MDYLKLIINGNLEIYCVTDKEVPFEKTNYRLAAVDCKIFKQIYQMTTKITFSIKKKITLSWLSIIGSGKWIN